MRVALGHPCRFEPIPDDGIHKDAGAGKLTCENALEGIQPNLRYMVGRRGPPVLFVPTGRHAADEGFHQILQLRTVRHGMLELRLQIVREARQLAPRLQARSGGCKQAYSK